VQYLGIKIIGVDSAACLIDFKKRKLIDISNDRITRIKKDNLDCKEALEWIESERDQDTEINLAASFSSFSSKTQLLENAASSFDYSKIERAVRAIYKPSFRSNLVPFNSTRHKLLRLLSIYKPNFLRSWVLRISKFDSFQSGRTPAIYSLQSMAKLLKEMVPKSMSKDICCIEFNDHHLCHSYSGYYLSNFSNKNCIVLTCDELGDSIFMTVAEYANGNFIRFLTREYSPKLPANKYGKQYLASVPSVYSNFTEALGLVRSSDEGKVEALAAYGKPCLKLTALLEKAFAINSELSEKVSNSDKEIRSLLVNDIESIKKLYSTSFLKEQLERLGKEDFAATVQVWLENFAVNYLKLLCKIKKIDLENTSIALAGGATANVIMNLKIFEELKPAGLFVTPPMGDEGTAIGAALISAHNHGENLTWISQASNMPYFGPTIPDKEIEHNLKKNLFKNLYYELFNKEKDLAKKLSIDLLDKKIVSIARGYSEFGPRALGNRSILAIPTSSEVRDMINKDVKRRPLYQPFCPAILEEDREELFEKSFFHKHMAIAFRMKSKFSKRYPSACHVDNTARPQFVTEKENAFLYYLLKQVKDELGHGILINTSFNLHGRSMVTTAKDALIDYIDCNIYSMVLGNYYISRQ